MKKIIQYQLLLAFVFIFIIRFIYHANNPVHYIFADTYQYLNRAQEIASGLPMVHYFRTPAYPILLKEILHLQGTFVVNRDTIYSINLAPVIKFQQAFGLIGAIFFIYLTYQLFGMGVIFWLTTILFGLDIHIFAWERNVLTESVVSTILLIFLFLIIKFISKRNIFYLLLSIVTSLVLFLLRPVFFVLIISLAPFLVYYFLKNGAPGRTSRTILIAITLISSLLFLTVPLYYAAENYRLYGFFGITNITDQDLFAKTIQYRLDAADIDSNNIYAPKLRQCITQHKPGTWIGTDDCLYSLGIANDFQFIHSATIAGSFAKRVIMKHPREFLVKTIKILPQVLINTDPDPFYWVSTYAKHPQLQLVWTFLDNVYILLQKLMIAFYLFYPLSVYRFLRMPSFKNITLVIFGSTVAYQVFFNAFFTQSDYIRLRNPILPELLLFCSYYYFVIFSRVTKVLTKRFKKTY